MEYKLNSTCKKYKGRGGSEVKITQFIPSLYLMPFMAIIMMNYIDHKGVTSTHPSCHNF